MRDYHDEDRQVSIPLEAVRNWTQSNQGLISFIAAIGSFASGLGLIVAAAQFNDARIAADAQAYAQISQGWHNHLELLMEQPDLRPYIYGGKPPPAEGTSIRARLDAYCDLRLDAMDRVLVSAKLAEWETSDLAAWHATFARAFAESPALCSSLKSVSEDYLELSKIAPPSCMPT